MEREMAMSAKQEAASNEQRRTGGGTGRSAREVVQGRSGRGAMRFYREMTYAEAGDCLAISEEAAKKRVSRATEKLRAI